MGFGDWTWLLMLLRIFMFIFSFLFGDDFNFTEERRVFLKDSLSCLCLVPNWGTRCGPWYPECQLADTECLARWQMVAQEAELDAESSWGGKSSPCPAQWRHSLGPFSRDAGSFLSLLLLLLRGAGGLPQWMTGSREEWARPWWWWESCSLTG